MCCRLCCPARIRLVIGWSVCAGIWFWGALSLLSRGTADRGFLLPFLGTSAFEFPSGLANTGERASYVIYNAGMPACKFFVGIQMSARDRAESRYIHTGVGNQEII